MRFSSGDHKNPNDCGKLAQGEIDLLCETIDAFLDTVQLHASMIYDGSDSPLNGLMYDEWFETGVPTFDELSVGEQLAILQSISRTLVTKKSLGRSESALHDAAIAVLIDCVRANVEIELDCERLFDGEVDEEENEDEISSWRERIHVAAADCANHPPSQPSDWCVDLLPVSETSFEKWSQLIDQLAEKWLPDRDYELAELFLDADPDQSMIVKEHLGILANYFVETIHEPAPGDFDGWLNKTRQLIRRKPR